MSVEVRIDRRPEGELDVWRDRARALLVEGVAPDDVVWIDGDAPRDLFAGARDALPCRPVRAPRVPRAFVELAERVACHRDPSRWDRLYRVLFRVAQGERALLEDALDHDVAALRVMRDHVARDEHHAQAYVRFRPIADASTRVETWIAWHRPDHRVLPLVAPFFAARFSDVAWRLETPDACVSFAPGAGLSWSKGAPRDVGIAEDAGDETWRTYWRATFDPARTNLSAMAREMPKKHWATLPETRAMRATIAEAPRRLAEMEARAGVLPRLEVAPGDVDVLREAARTCTACPLHGPATQVVFGEGPRDARIVLIGEQPGDEEDRAGRPFVGPAGAVLDEALREAGVDRASVYVTNAVKHFRFEPRGKVRLHQTPRARDVAACRPWVEAELAALEPEWIVCLGATAAKALLGATFRVTQERGVVRATAWAPRTFATWHPSAVLRAASEEDARAMRSELVRDLAMITE
ncbi:UdgX family uracil-DNA binding protein [Sandaracinus amylolyticus]|uniref:Type-4 uracil-DNA glycosylase n=1 Tax=Sandaracinus amylolyticus TaxID=927083 RepID=A0A0F6YHF8_9BACT|nr:UdgX family uracil-DNA binding protein [Sandaracinus amylolyticus]AKF05845.1 Uracil-DNA glycosylase, putative family 6 [Sandaracinus amylolyticus]